MACKKYLTKEDKNKSLAKNNRKYWKTKKGKLMLTYNNMKRRVDGHIKPHLYKDKEICDRGLFYKWSSSNTDYNTLYGSWVDSGYDKKLSPSIDRKDTALGYVIGNMQWITHSENSRKGAMSQHTAFNVKMNM